MITLLFLIGMLLTWKIDKLLTLVFLHFILKFKARNFLNSWSLPVSWPFEHQIRLFRFFRDGRIFIIQLFCNLVGRKRMIPVNISTNAIQVQRRIRLVFHLDDWIIRTQGLCDGVAILGALKSFKRVAVLWGFTWIIFLFSTMSGFVIFRLILGGSKFDGCRLTNVRREKMIVKVIPSHQLLIQSTVFVRRTVLVGRLTRLRKMTHIILLYSYHFGGDFQRISFSRTIP